MRGKPLFLRLLLLVAAVCVLLPLLLLLVWSFASRWPFPNLLPGGFSLRGIQELFGPQAKAPAVLGSSILLSLSVAVLATLVGLLAARALALYRFTGRGLVLFASVLPILVPSTVFAMGVQVLFLRWGWGDSLFGVVLAHVICALPYTVNILTDVTAALGKGLEEQAQLLGCPPLRAFFLASLPGLLQGALSAFSMAFIISFSQYFLTLLLGGGRVQTLSVVMVPFISGGDRSLASAYALLFLVSMLLVFALCEGLIRRWVAPGPKGEEAAP